MTTIQRRITQRKIKYFLKAYNKNNAFYFLSCPYYCCQSSYCPTYISTACCSTYRPGDNSCFSSSSSSGSGSSGSGSSGSGSSGSSSSDSKSSFTFVTYLWLIP